MDATQQAFLDATAEVPDTLGIPASPGASTGQQPPVSTFALTPEMISQLISFPFEMMAFTIGKGGEFWHLQAPEKNALGEAWLPIANRLLEMWGMSGQGAIVMAVGLTAASLGPRLYLEKARRASATATTATASFGASPASSVPPAAASHSSPTDLSEIPAGAYDLYPPA